MLDSLEKSIPGVRGHYERLSDVAHPNGFGHHQFYSTTNYTTAEVTFSRTKRDRAETWPSLSASLYAAAWTVVQLEQLAGMVTAIADLQAPSG